MKVAMLRACRADPCGSVVEAFAKGTAYGLLAYGLLDGLATRFLAEGTTLPACGDRLPSSVAGEGGRWEKC